MDAAVTTDQMISMERLEEITGIPRRTLYRRIQSDPHFPQPVKIGRLIRFYLSEVMEWMDRLKRERRR